MLLDRLDLLVAEGGAVVAAEAQRAEAAVLLVAPGAAGDLRHLGDGQPAVAAAVELLEAGEGDMGDVHVEAHADGVGGDEVIDLAALEHRHLGVAGGGRQRPHHHRRAAAEPAQHLGQRVDPLGGEGDDRGARRQARQLGAARIAKGGKARPADDLGVGQQLADHRPQRVGAEDQRFVAAARAKHAVGEHVAALGVDAELRLVDRGEGEIGGQVAAPLLLGVGDGHALGGAQHVAGVGRDDPFLAGQQRHLARALDRDDPVVDLAGEQPQREADDAGGMRAHPLDRQIGLAGVGGPEDRPHRRIVAPRHDFECGSAPAKRKLASAEIDEF